MNKQEALEALLRKVRGWEEPHEEVRATAEAMVAGELAHAAANLSSLQDKEALLTIGAAALYLLTDEVTVVEGRSLEEWLAAREGAVPFVADGERGVRFPRPGSVMVTTGNINNPTPINGAIGGRLDA